MAHEVRRVEYYYTTVQDRPGEALRFLTALNETGINMVALTAIPVGMLQTQLSIFPDDPARLRDAGHKAGFALEGPHHALLVQGEDVPGALVSIHEKLHQAGVSVYASTGVASGSNAYGYIVYVRPEEFDAACEALGI